MTYKPKITQYHLHKTFPERLQFAVYSLNEYRRNSSEKAAIPHSHSYYQIIWFLSDGGYHSVDFETYSIKKNTILFISKDSVHAFDDNLDVQGYLIHFNESFFMHDDVDIFLKYNVFNAHINPCHTVDEYTASTALTYIKLMQEETSGKQRFGYEDILRFSLKSFLIILERMHHDSEKKHLRFNNHHEQLFAQYKELVEENYKKNCTVTEYADLLNISSKTLTSITKGIVGKSASQLIADRVILEAQRLLKFTTLQVGEIAYKIGFEDASYFVKYFKRHVGKSPSQYRNSCIC